MIVGIDFDNTIINYENSFKELALKKKIISSKINQDKKSIRDYLRKHNKEKEWTILQGEVYGKYIMKAKIYEGVLDIFQWLTIKKNKIYIISHKTQFPYLGKKVDLRQSALNWINKNILINDKNIKLSKNNFFFENTIEEKIERIKSLKCDVFIDDLPEILELLPDNLLKILFSPSIEKKCNKKNYVMRNWNEFPNMIKKR